MFGKCHRRAAEPHEPGRVEGPHEIDRIGLGAHGVDCLRLQDHVNARHQKGYELVSHTHFDVGGVYFGLEEAAYLRRGVVPRK